ncbi:MAG: RNA polymerase sigma factor RpoH [Pseudomonadaceae bacterium]|nr:RNA polymerase sigma factor RpoH [Pseudomonadaceae bacterium]
MSEIIQDYLKSIQTYAPLSFDDEQDLARRWKDHKDRAALNVLMQSYLRLVVKVAMGFKGYGLPADELIQEGNIGLLQAINRFDPDKGFRLSTYAMWWIKAQIQEYILNNWSMVKIGTSGTQKKLFFNLRRLKNQVLGDTATHLTEDSIKRIAAELDVNPAEVVRMDQRLRHGDESLNVQLGDDDEGGSEWQDFLVEKRPNQEEIYGRMQLSRQNKRRLEEALGLLSDRERAILIARRLRDAAETPTLEELSQDFGISRERVRQLEERAFKKVQEHMVAATAH